MALQLPLFSIDSLSLVQKLTGLEAAVGADRLDLLSELAVKLRNQDTAQARLYGEEGLALAADLKDSTAYYQFCSHLAVIFAKSGKYAESVELQEKTLGYHRRITDKIGEATALGKLGSIHAHFGKYHIGDSLMNVSEWIYRDKKDEAGLLGLILERGLNYLNWTKYIEAEQVFQEALILSEELQDTLTTLKLWNNLGLVERRKGDYHKALEYYFNTLSQQKTDNLSKARTLNNIGIIYKSLEDYDKAMEYYQESLSIKEKVGSKKSIAYSLHNIGTLYKQQLDYGEALKCYQRSLDLKYELGGANLGVSKTLNNMGNVWLKLGDFAKAEKYYQESLEINKAEKNEDEIARNLINLASFYFKQGKYQEAIEHG